MSVGNMSKVNVFLHLFCMHILFYNEIFTKKNAISRQSESCPVYNDILNMPTRHYFTRLYALQNIRFHIHCKVKNRLTKDNFMRYCYKVVITLQAMDNFT